MRSRTAVIVGIALIVAALVLVLLVVPQLTKTEPNRSTGGAAPPGPPALRSSVAASKAAALAREGCVAFADVYEATRPGTPTDSERLATKLELAIDRLERAASEDDTWQPLSDAVARAGTAVNQGDTAGAAAAFADTHQRCRSTETS